MNDSAYRCKKCNGYKPFSSVDLCIECQKNVFPSMEYMQYVDVVTKSQDKRYKTESEFHMAFQQMKDVIFRALMDEEYERQREHDKTLELTNTVAKLAVEKADLEDKVKELTDTIARLSVLRTGEVPKKEVIHG